MVDEDIINMSIDELGELMQIFINERRSFFEFGIWPSCFQEYKRKCGTKCVYRHLGTVCPDGKKEALTKVERLELLKRLVKEMR
jgi:hypothetical protein